MSIPRSTRSLGWRIAIAEITCATNSFLLVCVNSLTKILDIDLENKNFKKALEIPEDIEIKPCSGIKKIKIEMKHGAESLSSIVLPSSSVWPVVVA